MYVVTIDVAMMRPTESGSIPIPGQHILELLQEHVATFTHCQCIGPFDQWNGFSVVNNKYKGPAPLPSRDHHHMTGGQPGGRSIHRGGGCQQRGGGPARQRRLRRAGPKNSDLTFSQIKSDIDVGTKKSRKPSGLGFFAAQMLPSHDLIRSIERRPDREMWKTQLWSESERGVTVKQSFRHLFPAQIRLCWERTAS